MAYRAIHAYPPLGQPLPEAASAAAGNFTPASRAPGLPESIAWAPPNLPPFNPAEYAPTRFAADQFTRWATQEMQQRLDYGRSRLSQALQVPLPKLPTLSQSEVGKWTSGYVQAHGVPKNIEDGARMVTALAHAQAEKAGVQPEWIAAADALMHPPTTVAEGFALVAEAGKGYFLTYGVPLLQQELMSLSSNLAMVAQAIPVQFAVAGFDALKDGKLSTEEVAGIAVQAAAYACGLLLQGIGIPAPLGALLCGVIAQGLTGVADSIIHGSDADTRARREAIRAIENQRATLMAKCAAAAPEAWNKTQEYWAQVLLPIQALMDQPEVAKRLTAAGGLRYYGRNTVTLPAGTTLPAVWPRDRWRNPGIAVAADEAREAARAAAALVEKNKYSRDAANYRAKAASAEARAKDLANKAAAEERKPLYEYGFDCVWWEGDLVFDYDPKKASLRQWLPGNARPYPDGCRYYTRMRPKSAGPQVLDPARWQASAYWPNPASIWERCAVALPPGGHSYDPPTFHASGEDAAHCQPSMVGANTWKYAFQAMRTTQAMAVRVTPYADHNSAVRVKYVTVFPGAMVDGRTNAQAALMFWGATRPVSPMRGSDAPDVEQWKSFAYISRSAIEVSKTDGELTAKLNVPTDYCDVNEWYAAVQTAAAAAALVQQDTIRTVAWQVGVEEAQRQAAWAKASADSVASASGARSAWKAAADAAIARQAAKALMQAKALGLARASSGAYSAALRTRLSYQAAQASAALQRTVLTVAGLAAGAFLIWKVAERRRSR